ncbi:MAG TPA: hypothetical protein VGK02_00665 [Candidatus Aquicultor sp.]|jgi:hypothetical protein
MRRSDSFVIRLAIYAAAAVLVLAAVLLAVSVAREVTWKSKLSDTALVEEGLKASASLTDFTQGRQANEPSVDYDNWNKSVQRLTLYTQESQNLYDRDYGPRIAFLRDEFAHRGFSDQELDQAYQNPVNYIGLRTVAVRLGVLSYKLKESIRIKGKQNYPSTNTEGPPGPPQTR